ncbi:MAG: PHP domain-containing protein [Nitrospirae bacterium]|nr:PHP domain-containing protein [Nitrospirota bacterium]
MTFKIDLHVHSKYSGDTDSEPEETVLHAIASGLRGIAFTEHYSYASSEFADELRGKYQEKILILRGVEFSAAEGHCLIFGVDTDRLDIKNASVTELIPVVNEKGGVAIPAHPFRVANSMGDKIKNLKGLYAIEGYNGYSHHSQNLKALTLAEEMNLPYTGGSDAHLSHEVGSCFTEFYNQVTYENFLHLLKKGNFRGVDTRKVSRAWPF